MNDAKLEAKLWAGLRPILHDLGVEAERVENRLAPAFPDVVYSARGVRGFIELKAVSAWPRREPFRVSTMLGDQWARQRMFLLRHGRAGGFCFMLLWVKQESEWLLFDHHGMASLDAAFTRHLMIDTCARAWSGWIHPLALLEALTKRT